MSARYVAVAVLVATLTVGACTEQKGKCLSYEPAVVSLSGSIVLATRFGTPNFGETPEQDQRVLVPLLTLPSPVDVCGDPTSELNSDTERGLNQLQLIGDSLTAYGRSGGEVTVTGTLMHAQTAFHYTRVLLVVAHMSPENGR